MDTVILIPAYKPDNALIETIVPLYERGFDVLVVNDGSPKEFDPVYEKASQYAKVIGYEKNKGKGHALKYGIDHIANNYKNCRYFITADADGQHSTEDILRTHLALVKNGNIVLGVREFQGKVPLRSRIGNDMSRFAYAIASGKFLPDNQCGLRGFDISLAKWLTSISGNKYDYEINVLMRAAIDNVKITELTVNTIYISGNKSSHFRPLQDTLLIHKRIWSAAWISLLSFVLNFVFVILFWNEFDFSEYAAEFSLLSAGGTSLIIGGILTLTIAPIVQMHIFRRFGNYMLRGTIFFAFAFILTELIFRLTSIYLPGSFIISEVLTIIAGYFTKKSARSIALAAKAAMRKEASNEKVF